MPLTPQLPLTPQIENLVRLGLPGLADISETQFRSLATQAAEGAVDGDVLVVGPALVPASRLAPLLSLDDRAGFVVSDMTDLDEFVDQVPVPDAGLYRIPAPDRGDDMRDWTPAEALAELESRGRRPLTLHEGISWLLQEPEQLERNHCFMTVGTRKPKPGGFDSRTPAIWISNGTGRDGAENRGAPKVGWCWWNNRHTWLGFASVSRQS